MHVLTSQRLFAWEALEDSPSLKTLAELLKAVPDAKLLAALGKLRGKGRDDYPVHVLWGVELLTVALRHTTTEACLAELHRNEALRRLIGIEEERGIPKKWNVSRFQRVLGEPEIYPLVREIHAEMIARLGEAIPDLGKDVAGDSCHLSGRAERAKGGEPSALPGPSGGRKEYTDQEGKVTKTVEWFGYKLHMLVDRKAELALSWDVTSARAADNRMIPALVEQARRSLPEGRTRTLAYDKAADDSAVHRTLAEAGIKPVIKITRHWEGETERMLPGHDGTSNVTYDELGTVYCYDKTSDPPVRRPMYYAGCEAARGTLKYRCPAVAQGFTCAHAGVCNQGRRYGKTVRVKREIDLRRFPPIPRATRQFEMLYKGRTSVERVNARVKVFWGADDGNVTGAERFHGRVGVIMVVHAAMATLLAAAPRRGATLGQTRLLPIARALRETWRN